MLLVGTMLGGWPRSARWRRSASARAGRRPPRGAASRAGAAPRRAGGTLGIDPLDPRVAATERLEPETVRSYANLAPGQTYTAETLDTGAEGPLRDRTVRRRRQITGADTGNLVIQVRENPVINRIVLEGNKRIKDDKITPEIRLAPRQIFTRSKVRADVARIIELYRRQGRFAATRRAARSSSSTRTASTWCSRSTRADKSKVRAINIIGNEQFGDGELRREMVTKRSRRLLSFFSSNDSYDPDRLASDQQKLRAFYLTQGYADFRVVSAVAELTPDRRDFIITYVVEEGERYKFGDGRGRERAARLQRRADRASCCR